MKEEMKRILIKLHLQIKFSKPNPKWNLVIDARTHFTAQQKEKKFNNNDIGDSRVTN